MNAKSYGWAPIPVLLKIIFVLIVVWILGSIISLPQRYTQGFPLFGQPVTGIFAILVVFVLDILGPGIFLFGLWKRKSWAPVVACVYSGLFLLNGIIALFSAVAGVGLAQVLVPNAIELFFLIVILAHWRYYSTR